MNLRHAQKQLGRSSFARYMRPIPWNAPGTRAPVWVIALIEHFFGDRCSQTGSPT
jgi:hypothetical protein